MSTALDILVADLQLSEGYREQVYDDAVSESSPYRYVSRTQCYRASGQFKVHRTGGTATIGFGETNADILDHYWDTGIPYAGAVELLTARANEYLMGALSYVTRELNPNQEAAIGSFAYNIGVGGFATSTVLRVVNGRELDRASVSSAFHKWDNPDGVLRGRRTAEIDRFFTDYTDQLDVEDEAYMLVLD